MLRGRMYPRHELACVSQSMTSTTLLEDVELGT